MSKKKLLSLALVVIMIAILSFSTLAWFNDSESVENKFMIATTEGGDSSNPDDIFSVDLWENTPGGDKDQDGHSYENILPGSNLKKEVNVQNTGAYDQYIRVVVTLSDANAWVEVLGYGYDLGSIFKNHDESKWTRSVGTHDSANDKLVYVYYLNEKLVPGATAELFTNVVIPTHLTQADMAKLNGGFELTIRADAIQTENFGDGIDTAAEAFAAANWGNYVNAAPVA